MNLPEAFVKQMAAQLGDELPAFLRSYEEPYQRGIRFNPLKGGKTLAAHIQPGDILAPVPWEGNGCYLHMDSRAGAHVLHEAGAWYLQEPSAMLPAAVLNARPGERVLDLCAAPGGKTTQLGLAMQGQGTLICNEPIRDRARILSRNVERMGLTNAVVVSAWPEELARLWPEAFDAIQCDAPCSGEGMFRRHPETRDEWNAESPEGCAKRQLDILDSAAKMLRPGGRMVYSTCTLNQTENEGVMQTFLAAHTDFKLEAFSLPGSDAPQGMLTCYPHRMKGEGHFVALLRRRGEGSTTSWSEPILSVKEQQMLRQLAAALTDGHGANWLHLTASDARSEEYELRRVPPLPQGKLPQVLRSGVHLGTVKIGRNGKGKAVFTPDHAWAVCCDVPDVPCVDLTEEQARLYQAGQTIPAEGKGWVLACFSGVALGWGKISDGMMKNHYPKGLRR